MSSSHILCLLFRDRKRRNSKQKHIPYQGSLGKELKLTLQKCFIQIYVASISQIYIIEQQQQIYYIPKSRYIVEVEMMLNMTINIIKELIQCHYESKLQYFAF